MSPSSASYRDAFQAGTGTDVGEGAENPPLPSSDPGEPGEFPINPALVAAFLQSIADKNLHIHFLCGSWSSYNIEHRFDVILTSETMYQLESIPDLLDVLWKAYANPPSLTIETTLEETMREKLSLDGPKCYVAGKALYFGVGGGLPDFISGLEDPRGSKCPRRNGKWQVLKEHSQGVVRKVLQVFWD
jgi:protein-histidine N-methyltransferase